MKKIITVISSLGIPMFFAHPVFADIDISVSKPPNLLIVDPGKLIGGSIGLILILAALAAFIFLIWGGVQWIMSGGDKTGVESAQHRIQAALLGLFIVFAAWALMMIVGGFLGFSLTNLKIPTPF